MRRLRPSIRLGLVCMAIHQLICVCGLLAAFFSESLFIALGMFLWTMDAPAFALASALIDVGGLIFETYGLFPVQGSPAMQLALTNQQLFIGVVAVLGALQWFLISFCLAEIRERIKRRETSAALL